MMNSFYILLESGRGSHFHLALAWACLAGSNVSDWKILRIFTAAVFGIKYNPLSYLCHHQMFLKTCGLMIDRNTVFPMHLSALIGI